LTIKKVWIVSACPQPLMSLKRLANNVTDSIRNPTIHKLNVGLTIKPSAQSKTLSYEQPAHRHALG
jgi:hypothetical protein